MSAEFAKLLLAKVREIIRFLILQCEFAQYLPCRCKGISCWLVNVDTGKVSGNISLYEGRL